MNARLSAAEIAALTQGELVGPADITVTGVAPIDRAGPDDLSFLASRRYLQYFQQSRAAVVLCKPDLAQESAGPRCRVLVRDPHVVCYSGTVIGNRVILHAGARLGSDGFGYVPGRGGELPRKVPQIGRCIIGDDVEIGANTTIDRGSVDDTVIGAGTKIDNLVQIGHNCRIGARCLIAGQAGIAGSTHVEDDVFLAGQAGLADHVTIGRGARVTVQGGVIGDIPPGATVSGYPARSHREFLRAQGALYRLAQIVDDLEALVRRKEEPHQ